MGTEKRNCIEDGNKRIYCGPCFGTMLGSSDKLITDDSNEFGTEALYCENCGWDWDIQAICGLPIEAEKYRIPATTRAPMTR